MLFPFPVNFSLSHDDRECSVPGWKYGKAQVMIFFLKFFKNNIKEFRESNHQMMKLKVGLRAVHNSLG